MSIETPKETLGFQAEIQQLLKLMIHSMYSNKEIFLRELISNASDAADKLRFEALTNNALYEGSSDLKIHISFDKDQRTVTVSDNGIGMSREEVIDHIGTIAKSGTRQFFDSLTGDQAKDTRLIGQFGVGFYSAFIVADKVTLTTRRAGQDSGQAVRWESNGEGTYTLEMTDKPMRGTEVTLHLRPEEDEFLDNYRLRNIISKYSDHISLPIIMKASGKAAPGVLPPAALAHPSAADEDETVNRASALWARPKKDITEQEYADFYKHVSHDFEEPLAHVHSRVEGNQSYTTLFYVPKRAPFDLWDRDARRGIKLYVRRVFIMEDAEQLMPNYLRFVRGVVDSDDLPLNVSREILQRNKSIDAIRAASVKKVLGVLEDLAKNEPEKYAIFWKEFGRVIKEGPVEDFANRERIAKLLRFASTYTDSEAQEVALGDYVERMKTGQDKIYYVTADSFAAAKNSPHLEIFRKKGIEVLLLSDRVDEWLTSHLNDFAGKPLQSIAKGDLDLGEMEDQAQKDELEKVAGELKDLTTKMQETLGDKVKEVRISQRLTRSPSCLVVEEHDMAVNFQKMLKAAGHAVPSTAPILEINPQHPLVMRLNKETDAQRIADWTYLLFDQALLNEGGQLDDPTAFVQRLNDMLMSLATENSA